MKNLMNKSADKNKGIQPAAQNQVPALNNIRIGGNSCRIGKGPTQTLRGINLGNGPR